MTPRPPAPQDGGSSLAGHIFDNNERSEGGESWGEDPAVAPPRPAHVQVGGAGSASSGDHRSLHVRDDGETLGEHPSAPLCGNVSPSVSIDEALYLRRAVTRGIVAETFSSSDDIPHPWDNGSNEVQSNPPSTGPTEESMHTVLPSASSAEYAVRSSQPSTLSTEDTLIIEGAERT